MKFCAFCETPAVAIIGETDTPVCSTCADVYQCGQSNPDHTLVFGIDDDEEDD